MAAMQRYGYPQRQGLHGREEASHQVPVNWNYRAMTFNINVSHGTLNFKCDHHAPRKTQVFSKLRPVPYYSRLLMPSGNQGALQSPKS